MGAPLPSNRFVVSGIILAGLSTFAVLVWDDLLGQRGASGKGHLILIAIMGVAGYFFFNLLLLGGGLRLGSVLASYVRLKHDEFVWLDTLDLGRNEGVELWGEYKYGRGRSARLDCFLVRHGDTDKPQADDARALRAVQPRRTFSGLRRCGTQPVDHGIILRPATPGRFHLGALLESRADGETGIEFNWCRTVSFARLRIWPRRTAELPSVELPD